MTDAERRVAEADAYLQRLEEKQEDIQNEKFRDLVYTKEMEKKLELSQMSQWTEDITLVNKEVKKGQKRLMDKALKASEPEREAMVETIISLRQQKNIH